jgi:ADP-ribose pyrophosphatase
MIQPWEKIGSKPVGDFRIFTIRSDLKVSPRTGEQHDFYVIESVHWVHVIAATPDRHLVMIEQFRHGSNTVELELPGGMMDKEDVSPVETAVRELQEETGYSGENGQIIGQVFANPAILTNISFTVLVENCELTHAPALDGGEDLITRLVPIDELPGLVAAGKIRHSLMVAGLYHYELWQRNNRGTERR